MSFPFFYRLQMKLQEGGGVMFLNLSFNLFTGEAPTPWDWSPRPYHVTLSPKGGLALGSYPPVTTKMGQYAPYLNAFLFIHRKCLVLTFQFWDIENSDANFSI